MENVERSKAKYLRSIRLRKMGIENVSVYDDRPVGSDKTVLVELKSRYGNELIYPANDTAKLFTGLTRKKTLLREDLDLISELGYAIKVKQPEPLTL